MQYVIVQNQTVVLLGPIDWRQRFIQSEFDDLGVAYKVPPTEPGYVNIDQVLGTGSTTGIEIFPITGGNTPAFDPLFEYLAGPTWSYANQQASLNYTLMTLDVASAQRNLIALTAVARYNKEVAGTTTSINGTTVSLTTDRVGKQQYTYLLNSIGTGTVNWKFPQGWITVNQTIAQQMVTAVGTYVQAQFDWESNMVGQINAATTISALQALVPQIVPPPPTPTPPVL